MLGEILSTALWTLFWVGLVVVLPVGLFVLVRLGKWGASMVRSEASPATGDGSAAQERVGITYVPRSKPKKDPWYNYIPFATLSLAGFYFLWDWDVSVFGANVFYVAVGLAVIGLVWKPTRDPTIGFLLPAAIAVCIIAVLLFSFGSYEPSLWR